MRGIFEGKHLEHDKRNTFFVLEFFLLKFIPTNEIASYTYVYIFQWVPAVLPAGEGAAEEQGGAPACPRQHLPPQVLYK